MRNAPLNFVNKPHQNRGKGLKGLTGKISARIKEGIDNVKDDIAGELDFRSYKKQNKSVMQEYPDFRAEDLYRANVQPSDTIVSRTSILGQSINQQVLNNMGRENYRKVGGSGGNYAANKDSFKLTRKNYLNK
jgi:hypothetical protein